MYKTGSKIQLVASNVKNIGPKTGSIGYVIDSHDIVRLSTLKEVGYVVRIYVEFIRYGFETGQRVEKRNIFHIIPLNTGIDFYTSLVHSPDFISALERVLDTKDIICCVAVPINKKTYFTKDKNEGINWLNSFFSSYCFQGLLENLSRRGNKDFIKNTDIEELLSLVENKNKKSIIFSEIRKGNYSLLDLIRSVQKVSAVYEKNKLNQSIQRVVQSPMQFLKPGSILTTMILSNLYLPGWPEIKEKILEKTKETERRLEISEIIKLHETVRDSLDSFSRSLETKG